MFEVRHSRMGYLLPVRDAERTLPDVESCWDAAAVPVAAASRCMAPPQPAPARPDTQSISSDNQSISSDTQSISSDTQSISSGTQSISSDTQSTAIYGLPTRNIWTDGPYMDFLPGIYGPCGPYVNFPTEHVTCTVHIWTFEGKIDRRIENTFF